MLINGLSNAIIDVSEEVIIGYTKYGEFIRILRVKHHEVIGDTAKLFDVKVPFVSAVESGKKNVPETWIPIIIEHYNLSAEEQMELLEAIEESKPQIKLNMVQSELLSVI